MKMQIVGIRDVKSEAYATPIFVPSVGHAERQFADEINRAAEDNILYKHPEDFELYLFGSFDALSGLFDLLERPRILANGRAVIRAVPGDTRQLPLSGVN